MQEQKLARRDILLSMALLSGLGACGGDPAAKLIGTDLPNLTIQTLDKKSFNLGNPNRPMILHFFGLWCPTCIKDWDNWNAALSQLTKYQSIDIISIHVGEVPKQFESLEKWHSQLPKELQTLLVDDKSKQIFNALKLPGTPSTLHIDSGGRIIEHTWDLKSRRAATAFVRKTKEFFGLS